MRERLLPRPLTTTAAWPSTCAPPRARASSSTRAPTPPTSPRWPTRASPPTTPCARPCPTSTPAPPPSYRGRAAWATRDPGARGDTGHAHRRRRPQPRRPRAGQADRRRRDRAGRRQPGGRRPGPHQRRGRRRGLRLRGRTGRRERRVGDDRARRVHVRARLRRQGQIPTLDFVGGEKNIIGNIVGTYPDLVELMVLAQAGKVTLHTKQYPLDAALDALHDLDAGRVRGRADSGPVEEGVPPHVVREGWREVLHRRRPQPFLGRQPENWKPGREEYAKGWIDCFYGYHQLAPPETHWDYEKYLKVTPEDFEQDMFIDGYVDKVIFQSTYLYDWYTEGFNTADRTAAQGPAAEVRRPVHRQRAVRPARGRGGPQAARRGRQEVEPEGRQGLHRRVARGLARLAAGQPRGLPLPGEVPGAGHQEHPRAQGPDDLAARQGRVRPRRHRRRGDRSPGPELHRRARGHPAHRELLLHGGAGAQRVRGPVRGDRRPDARPAEVRSPRSWAS